MNLSLDYIIIYLFFEIKEIGVFVNTSFCFALFESLFVLLSSSVNFFSFSFSFCLMFVINFKTHTNTHAYSIVRQKQAIGAENVGFIDQRFGSSDVEVTRFFFWNVFCCCWEFWIIFVFVCVYYLLFWSDVFSFSLYKRLICHFACVFYDSRSVYVQPINTVFDVAVGAVTEEEEAVRTRGRRLFPPFRRDLSLRSTDPVVVRRWRSNRVVVEPRPAIRESNKQEALLSLYLERSKFLLIYNNKTIIARKSKKKKATWATW